MNKLRKSVLGILLISMMTGFFGLGGKGNISGLVKDKNGNPVEGATVTSENIDYYSEVTESDGKFSIYDVPDGSHTITAVKGVFKASTIAHLEKPVSFDCKCPDATATITFGDALKTIITENFESYSEISNGTGGWQIASREPSTEPVIASIGAANTGKSLLLEAENDGVVDVMRSFDSTSISSISLLGLEGYIRVSNTSTELHIGFVRLGYGGINIMNEDGEITVYYGENMNDSKSTGTGIIEDKWHKIKLTIDIENSEWTVWIDDDKTGTTGIYDDDIAPSIFVLELVTEIGEPSRNAYFDEIKVTATLPDPNKAYSLNNTEIPDCLLPGLFNGFQE